MLTWADSCFFTQISWFVEAIEVSMLAVGSLLLEWRAHEWEASPIDKRASSRDPFFMYTVHGWHMHWHTVSR